MTIKVDSTQTIFDIALIAYGDASKVYDLIAENPDLIENVMTDLTGLTLTYTPTNPIVKEATIVKKSIAKVVTIKSEQNIFDLSLQYYGSAEDCISLIKANTFIENLNSSGFEGNQLNYTLNNNLAPRYYRENKIEVATGFPIFEVAGVNYLKQENGFFILQENGFKIKLES